VLNKGRRIHQGTVAEVLSGKNIVEVASMDMDKLKSALDQMGEVKELRREQGRFIITLNGTADPSSINRFLFDHDVIVSHLSLISTSLEKQFLEILKESDDTPASN
jgi:ABC-type uncharacterized transport system ATPase subunit